MRRLVRDLLEGKSPLSTRASGSSPVTLGCQLRAGSGQCCLDVSHQLLSALSQPTPLFPTIMG